MRTLNKRRRKNGRLLSLAAAAASLLLSLPSPATPQRRPEFERLPAFEVTDLSGRVFASGELPMRENWVLVYVRPNCRPCEAVFRALGDERSSRTNGAEHAAARRAGESGGAAASRRGRAEKGGARASYFADLQGAPQKLIIVVGGASVEELKAMAAAMPWIPQAVWYADPERQLTSKMKWQAAPVVAGVREGSIVWRYTGVPPEGLPLRSLMSNWHERPAHPNAPAGPPVAPPRRP